MPRLRLPAPPLTRLPLVALLLAAGPAASQQVDCAKPQAQAEMTYCAEQDWTAADARLNEAYQIAIAGMKDVDSYLEAPERGAEAALRSAQRAWVAFRDATCAAEGWSYHGGSAEPMVIYQCRARVSQQRADELDAMTAEQ